MAELPDDLNLVLTREERHARLEQRLGPLPPGHIRGRIDAVLSETIEGEFGQETLWHLRIRPQNKQPLFTIIMQGLTIEPRPRGGMWVQMEWNDPPDRTIHAKEVFLPYGGNWMRSFNMPAPVPRSPGRNIMVFAIGVLLPAALIVGAAVFFTYNNFFR